jgi:hypothetical protein
MHSKLTSALACACALAIGLTAAATLPAQTPAETTTATTRSASTTTTTTSTRRAPKLRRLAQRSIQRRIDRYRHETWRWQRTMGRRIIRELRHPPASAEAKIAVWRRVARKTRRVAQNPPHERQWLCIHRYEGSWSDPAPPYYGGLQMDLSFQRAYGAGLLRTKGTADRWTPLEQMWVAERAHRTGLGFSPWPNTARNCGLL